MTAARILSVAASQIGYVETPVNRTKYGAWYGWDGVAWCDIFASWCAAVTGETKAVGKFAYTPYHAKWFQSQGRIVASPQPGDLVFYAWSGGAISGIDHVEFFEKRLDATYFYAIGGNTSNLQSAEARRNGGGVVRNQRSMAYVAAIARPAYSTTTRPVMAVPLPTWYRRVLTVGTHGLDVQGMQRRLNVYGAKLAADGAFGPATLARVKLTQQAHSVTVDGVVGPITARIIGG